MYKFTATLCVAALVAGIITETMLTQEIQIHVAMGTNRAFLEIAASVKPSPDSSHDLIDVPLAFRAARLFGMRIEEIFHDQDPAPL
jgi:hypothetical protein